MIDLYTLSLTFERYNSEHKYKSGIDYLVILNDGTLDRLTFCDNSLDEDGYYPISYRNRRSFCRIVEGDTYYDVDYSESEIAFVAEVPDLKSLKEKLYETETS